jgi:pyruvate dehydrogenase E1 component alpha subunit
MASLWKLPVIYVIENNQYSMGTAIERSSAAHEHMYSLGGATKIPGDRVYGMDVEEVKAAIARARTHCSAGKGPYILEMRTYRYRGHSMSDPAQYRSKEEVARIRSEHDPITLLYDRIIKARFANEDGLKQIDREVRAVVAEAASFAESSSEPEPAELYTDVMAGA